MSDSNIKKARVSVRIDKKTKDKAEDVLAEHGLTLSEFIRMNLTTLANEGLPKYYGLPNHETLSAIHEGLEVLDDQLFISVA